MACSKMKKVVLGTVLGAGALFVALHTPVGSSIRTAFDWTGTSIKKTFVSPETEAQFEIDRTRREIAELEPAIKENLVNVANAEMEVKKLEREIDAIKANHATEAEILTTLRSSLDTGDFKLAGNVTYTADEIKSELSQRLPRYKQTSATIKIKEDTLKSKKKLVLAANQELSQMQAAKQGALAELAAIEARLKMIETTKERNNFNFDKTGNAMTRLKSSLADLHDKVDVIARTAELEGQFSGSTNPVIIEPKTDVLKEMDAEFGPPATKTSGGSEKSL
jgi:peptidoglycan hydrolase CwlO-like protein